MKLYSATEASRAISFNLLHKGCGSRLKQQYICIKEEVPVAREDMVKGYEFAKDQYVMFTPEELKALEEAGHAHAPRSPSSCRSKPIDPVYFDKAYYLAPDKGGAKPYALLARALRESKRCALGRWAARGKQYIVMIRPVEDGLVMQQLLYAGEVRSIKDIEIPKTEVKDAELKLAQQLIEQQASDTFDPSAYKDEVRARIEAAVQKKVEGQEITMAEAPKARRAGHRSHGSAAREPREEGARAKPRDAATAEDAQAAQARAARRARRAARPPRDSESARSNGPRHAPIRRARRREAASPAAQHDPRADRGRVRVARARAAQRVALLVPGSRSCCAPRRRSPRRRCRAAHHDVRCRSFAAIFPTSMPLSGLSICAVADRVVVKEGGSRWQAESGPVPARIRGRSRRRLLERDRTQRTAQRVPAPSEWFDRGVALENEDSRRGASMRTSAPSPPTRALLDAHINLGWLLHEAGRFAKAERVYRDAIEACGNDPVLLYNLGVLLEDMDRKNGSDGSLRSGAARQSGSGRLPLQPRAVMRRAREAERSHSAHGALPPPDGDTGKVALSAFANRYRPVTLQNSGRAFHLMGRQRPHGQDNTAALHVSQQPRLSGVGINVRRKCAFDEAAQAGFRPLIS